MKRFLTVLLAMILLTAATTAHAEKTPVRLARLPIILQSSVPDSDTCAELEVKIARAVHIPLNGTLQLVDYIPPKESAQVLHDIWKNIRATNKNATIQDAIRPLAAELDADIIVCPILNRYGEYTSYSARRFGEAFLTSHARAELIVYDRRTDDFIDKKATQYYHDEYSTRGTASFLAKVCFDRVIEDTGLRKLIIAIR